MIYNLMHKNFVVAILDIALDGSLLKITHVNDSILPIGAQMNDIKFHEWWKDRAVPKSRRGAKFALRALNIYSTDSLLLQSLGLSLNDCYWLLPEHSPLCWENVNLFNNNFTDVFGELTFDTTRSISNDLRNTKFLHATSQGELQKKWCIDNSGRRFLIKGNSERGYQQSLNEVFASLLHCKQGCTFYTHYYPVSIEIENGGVGLGCYSFNFCSESIESFSCWEALQLTKVRNGEYYYRFRDICLSRGISESYFNTFISYQIMTDFLLTNTDRHLNNIAVLRSADTLQWIGLAPIYDTGNSMFFSEISVPHGGLLDIPVKSFATKEVNLLKYVTDRNCVNLDLLPTYQEFYEIYSRGSYDISRVDALYNVFIQKVRLLKSFQNGADLWKHRSGHKIR